MIQLIAMVKWKNKIISISDAKKKEREDDTRKILLKTIKLDMHISFPFHFVLPEELPVQCSFSTHAMASCSKTESSHWEPQVIQAKPFEEARNMFILWGGWRWRWRALPLLLGRVNPAEEGVYVSRNSPSLQVSLMAFLAWTELMRQRTSLFCPRSRWSLFVDHELCTLLSLRRRSIWLLWLVHRVVAIDMGLLTFFGAMLWQREPSNLIS